VVDNNCTDETPAVVERHRREGRIPGLRRIVETRQGLTHARLCGVRNTEAEWVAFIDDDCFLDEDWVAQALRFAGEHPECGAFGGRNVLDWEVSPSALLAKYGAVFAQQDHGPVALRFELQVPFRPALAGAGLVMRRVALERSGWLETQLIGERVGAELTSGGDQEIVIRICQAGFELWYAPRCVLRHFIPRHRTSEAYLVSLYYGIGAMMPPLDRLIGDPLWPRAYWLRVVKGAIKVVLLRFVLKRLPEYRLSLSYLKGLWNAKKGAAVGLRVRAGEGI
jgi:glycosyltransferase involved in cell wall biosynthesis